MQYLSKAAQHVLIPHLIGLALFMSMVALPVFVSAQPLVESCALEDPASGNYCDDVNSLVSQIIRIGEYLLGIAGSLALVMFVYGGFTFLTSQGQSERAKKGMQIVFAAVIGLFITFAAYIIVDFVLVEALQVDGYFR